jgi:hypothetical protein
MSVMKENATKRLIDQILASLRVGKIAIMDKALNINSSNPVENKVITQAINGLSNSRPQVIADRGSSYAVLDNVKFITYQKNVSLSMSPQGINWVKVTDLNTDLFPPSVTHSTNWLVFANISNQNGDAIIISAKLDKLSNWEVWMELYNPSSAIDLTMTVDLMIVDVREV